MSKRKSIAKFAIIAIIAVIGILLTCFKFYIPGTDKNFNGFANSIKLGLDLKGGVEAVYEASVPEGSTISLDNGIKATIQRLTDLLSAEGYSESTITKQNQNQVRVEIPDVDDPDTVLEMIGEPAKLAIRKEKLSDNPDAEIFISGDNIKNVEVGYQDSTWGVVLQFDQEGAEIFKDLTTELAGTENPIHIYLGDDEEPFSSPTVSSAITGGSTFISGSMDSQADAEEFALKIQSGTFQVELTLLSNNNVSATLGLNALKYGIIAGLVGLVLIFIFMCIVYRELGILASFSLVFYVVIMMFLLQAIPFVQLTLPGIAGIILSLGMAVDANVIIFERMKDEYRVGKKIPAAMKSGFKKANISIIDSNVTTIIASIVLYILGSGSIKGFAITLLIGILVSMFTSLVMTRTFVKWYMPLNSTNAKRLNFKREVGVNELG